MQTAMAGVFLLCLFVSSDAAPFDFWASRKVKTDCATNVWSDWKCVGSTCARSREVVRKAQHGGTPCPHLSETKKPAKAPNPWDQNALKVTTRVQSKFVAGTKRVVTIADGKENIKKAATNDVITNTKVILPRDVLFLLDMSGSISPADFHKTKLKLAELIGYLCGTVGAGKQNNRIAVVSFSTNVQLNFDFKTHFSLQAVKKAIMSIKQERRATCTAKAFEFAHSYMFDPSKGIRSAVESVKEVNVLTDGESNCAKLSVLAANVKRLQVKAFVFAMAIGRFSKRGQKQIESMVSRPLIDHIFSLANFQTFADMVDTIKKFPGGTCVPFELS